MTDHPKLVYFDTTDLVVLAETRLLGRPRFGPDATRHGARALLRS
jgi:hypothetical protein